MAYITSIVVYDSKLFNRTGSVRRWADGVERKFTLNAIEEAPFNRRQNKSSWDAAFPPGSMKASISGNVERIGPVHLQTTVSVNVPYATYVINGTEAIIRPHGSFLNLPSNPGFGTHARHKFVRGQRANNFLARAGEQTARTHPSLRGFGHQMFRSF